MSALPGSYRQDQFASRTTSCETNSIRLGLQSVSREIRANSFGPQGRRVALYSHDTMGIGHLRRNLLIAQTLIAAGQVDSVLLITGIREAFAFCLPQGVDCLTLPSLGKNGDGTYAPRSLGVTLRTLVRLRREAISAALHEYHPELLIVDKVPRGIQRELEPALAYLRRAGTKCVLGMRDVLDDPAVVRRQWSEEQNDDAVDEFYDAVWIYSDPKLFDPVHDYGFRQSIVAKVHYTGYFDQRRRLDFICDYPCECSDELPVFSGKLALCMVGGGQDGEPLARAFASAQLPFNTDAVLVTGPFMPSTAYRRLCHEATDCPRLHLVRFVAEPAALIARADRVIAMGGYNTINEVLSFRKPALIAPRTAPRGEQWIRAKHLAELGLVDVIHPEMISPNSISAWLEHGQANAPSAYDAIDFGGLSRISRLFGELVSEATRTVPEASPHTLGRQGGPNVPR